MQCRNLFFSLFAAAAITACAPATLMQNNIGAELDRAIAGTHRPEANRLRDQYRHPRETLLFFGLRPEMTVVEIWPGGGWYSEILGPVLRPQGRYYLAQHDVENPKAPDWQRKARANQEKTVAEQPAVYGKPVFTSFGPPDRLAIAPAGSADLVLTFRNVHNWAKAGVADAMFKAFHDTLKPGGVLGVEEHRAKPGTSFDDQVKSGYMTEQYVIETAEKAGFRFVAKAEINANLKDTKDYASGVWTLPPTLRLGDQDKDKYLAIGESDRMTLKFIRPM